MAKKKRPTVTEKRLAQMNDVLIALGLFIAVIDASYQAGLADGRKEK